MRDTSPVSGMAKRKRGERENENGWGWIGATPTLLRLEVSASIPGLAAPHDSMKEDNLSLQEMVEPL